MLEIIDTSKVELASGVRVDYTQYAIQIRAMKNLKYIPDNKYDAPGLLRAAADAGSVDGIKEILTLRGVDVNSTDENGETALHFAAKTGSRQCMEILIQQGASITKRDSSGFLPLHCAALSSPVECIDTLFELGSNPEEKTADNKSLSHLAAKGDNEGLLKMLMERFGEKLLYANDRDESGSTPILLAATAASHAALRFLLQFSDPNDTGSDGEPLLHHAAERLGLSDIRSIIERGADPLSKCAHSRNILHHLASNPRANSDYFQMAFDYEVSRNDLSVVGASPLHVLLSQMHFHDHPKVDLALLLTSETNINIPDKSGITPLHILLDANIVIDVKLRLLTSFLDKGADVILETASSDSFFRELIRKLLKTWYSNTPKGIKEWLSETSHIRRLLNMAIATVSETQYLEQPVDGVRPLQACLRDESLSLQLLSKGINPNLRNTLVNGTSALEIECKLNRDEINENLILKLGEAYKQAPSSNQNGDSLLHILCRENCSNVALLNHICDLVPDVNIRGVNGDLCLITLIRNSKVTFVERLLNFGARLDLKGGQGQCYWYPLHWAAFVGHHDILQMLYSQKIEWTIKTADFSFNGQNFTGCSALHLAVLKNQNQITTVNFLLDRALINLDAQDDSGRTPLHFAAQFTDAEMVQNLIDRGADIELVDKNGDSVLHHGVSNVTDQEDILALLVSKGAMQAANKRGDTPEMLAMCEGKSKAVEILRDFRTDKGTVDILHQRKRAQPL